MDLHRLGRIDVLLLHEPARLVGADRQQRQVEAAIRRSVAAGEARADVGEVLRVAGVAGEEDLEVGREHGVAAPERRHPVGERAARTNAAPARTRSRRRPTLAVCHQSSSTALSMPASGEPGLDAERHDEQRRAAGLGGERLDRRRIEMVVVVVRDQHRIDARQLGRGRAPAGPPASGRRTTPARRAPDSTGSVSKLMPPICSSTLAWPTQVAAGSIAAPAAALRRRNVEVGRHAAASRCVGSGGRPSRIARASTSGARPVRAGRSRCSCSGSGRRDDAAVSGRCRRRGRHGFFGAHERRQPGRAGGRGRRRRHAARVEASAIIALPTPVWVGDGRVSTYNLGLCRKSPCRGQPPTR